VNLAARDSLKQDQHPGGRACRDLLQESEQ